MIPPPWHRFGTFGTFGTLGYRDHPIGLDIELLLMAGPVFALEHQVRIAKSALDVALVDGDVLERRG